MSKLSTTAYALLGLIAMRPISTYEVAQWMRGSNLRALWPRAESQVYKEPKKLAGTTPSRTPISIARRSSRVGRKQLA